MKKIDIVAIIIFSFLIIVAMVLLFYPKTLLLFYPKAAQDFSEDYVKYVQDGIVVYMYKDVRETLFREFWRYCPNETAICLYGQKQDNVYIINNATIPKQIREEKQVTFACPNNTIADAHTHPNGICLPSEKDKKSLSNRNYELGFIVCAVCVTSNQELEEINIGFYFPL